MNNFYVYAYLREDGTPYYIGKGKGNRAWIKGKNEVGKPKDNTRIILLKENLSDNDAKSLEIYLIGHYGRKDMGEGILYNKTNGGDGVSLFGEKNPMYGKIKEKHHHYGKKRQEIAGENNPMYGKKGKAHPAYRYVHTENTINIIKKSKIGVKRTNFDQKGIKNPMYGKIGENNPNYGKTHTKYQCCHCHKIASNAMLKRWHNDNCKHRKYNKNDN